MKLKITSLVLLAATVICLAACNSTEPPPTSVTNPTPTTLNTSNTTLPPTDGLEGEYPFSVSSHQKTYENMFFYKRDIIYGGGIRYQFIDDMKKDGYPVFKDRTGTKTDPLAECNDMCFLVDPVATAKNDNNPVIIVCYHIPVNLDITQIDPDKLTPEYLENLIKEMQTPYKMASIDVATGEMTVISDDLGKGECGRFYLWNDTIYYFLSNEVTEGKYQTSLYSMDKNGENVKELCSDFEYVPELIGIYNDRIYYYNQTKNWDINVVDMNFENPYVLMTLKNPFPTPFIHDGYIYYYDDYSNIKLEGDEAMVFSLYKSPLDGFNQAVPEIIIEKVYNIKANSKTVLYSLPEDLIIKEGYYSNYFETTVIRGYDLETGEHKVLLNNKNEKDPGYDSYYVANGDFFEFQDDEKTYFYQLSTNKIYSFPGTEG